MSDRREVGVLLLVRNLKRDKSTKGHGLNVVVPSVSDAEHVRHGLKQGPRVLFQPIGFLKEIRKQCRSSGMKIEARLLTCSSLIATQELDGKPCSIGTRNCRHPLQWPMRSIMQIRLKIRMNTEAMLRNCNESWRVGQW